MSALVPMDGTLTIVCHCPQLWQGRGWCYDQPDAPVLSVPRPGASGIPQGALASVALWSVYSQPGAMFWWIPALLCGCVSLDVLKWAKGRCYAVLWLQAAAEWLIDESSLLQQFYGPGTHSVYLPQSQCSLSRPLELLPTSRANCRDIGSGITWPGALGRTVLMTTTKHSQAATQIQYTRYVPPHIHYPPPSQVTSWRPPPHPGLFGMKLKLNWMCNTRTHPLTPSSFTAPLTPTGGREPSFASEYSKFTERIIIELFLAWPGGLIATPSSEPRCSQRSLLRFLSLFRKTTSAPSVLPPSLSLPQKPGESNLIRHKSSSAPWSQSYRAAVILNTAIHRPYNL